MSFEIGKGKPKKTDYTFDGEPLFIRRLSLRLGLKMQSSGDSTLPPEIVAEIISECAVREDGTPFWSMDDVLQNDIEPMLKVFSLISDAPVSIEEAEKN